MKFRMRFADQIVGFFIILAVLSVAFIIIMLGRAQRWFAKDISFRTEFVSATGLSPNMPVLYKGFTIGNVKSYYLNANDQVEVVFYIYEQYKDRAKYGSMVELMVNPIGLGNQFFFHPGNSRDSVNEGDFIPAVGSAMANNFIRQGLADSPRHDDSISLLVNRVNNILGDLSVAMGEGTDLTEIGRIMGSVSRTLADIEALPDVITQTVATVLVDVDDIKIMLDNTLSGINPIITDINAITTMLASPGGTVSSILDSDGEIHQSLTKSIDSLSGIISELEKTAAFIPRQLPQIAGIIAELSGTLRAAEDVLVALTNNPLLRNGIPQRIEVQSSGTSPRDIRF